MNAQQIRAFNLAYALCSTRKVTRNTKVAVVGAGISGLTVALALASKKKCQVSVYDQSEHLFGAFALGTNRWIDDGLSDSLNINPWGSSDSTFKKFPFLFWRPDFGDEIAFNLTEQWKHYTTGLDIRVHLRRKIHSVFHNGKTPRLVFPGGGRSRNFDFVILATGFQERQDPETKTPGYWESGSWSHYHHKKSRGTPKVLISGSGDSGLVDLFNNCIENFRHEKLAELVSNIWHPTAFLHVEREDRRAFDIDKYNPRIASKIVRDAYHSLIVPRHVIDRFRRKLRRDQSVWMNSRSLYPYSPSASQINKVLLRCLEAAKAFTFVSGRLDIKGYGDRFKVKIGSKQKTFDHVYIRWGLRPQFERNFKYVHECFAQNPYQPVFANEQGEIVAEMDYNEIEVPIGDTGQTIKCTSHDLC